MAMPDATYPTNTYIYLAEPTTLFRITQELESKPFEAKIHPGFIDYSLT